MIHTVHQRLQLNLHLMLSKKLFLTKKIGVATTRAGNVIGGADWSENRIVPDLIKSIKNKKFTCKKSFFNSTLATCA